MTDSTSANTHEDNETDQQQFMAKVLQRMKTLEDKVDSLNAWKQQVAYQNDEVELHAHSDIEEGEDNVTQVRTTEDDVRSLVATFSGDSQNPNNGREGVGDSILDKLFEDLSKQDKLGPPINDKLVSIVNKLHAEPKEETQIKDLLKKWPKPSNCELNVPRVNPEIWKVMQNHQQTQDVKLQKVQELLITAIVPLVTVADSTLSNKGDLHSGDSGNNLSMILESITLILEVHHELNLRRREAIRPYLKDEFRPLCSKNTKPSNDLLFGDNLDEQIKQLQNKRNLGSSLCKPSRDKNKGTYRNKYQP